MHRIFALLCCFLLLASYAPVALAQDSETLTITTVDTSEFPEIRIVLRNLDSEGMPVTGRSVTEFQIEVGDTPVESTVPAELTTVEVAPAVAVIVDLSAQMNDRGTLGRTRSQDMARQLGDLLQQLPNGSQASMLVIEQQVQLIHPLTTDLGAMINTINDTNPDLPFQPQPVDTADSAYPLQDAIEQSLEQLVQAPATMPRALFIFAAGTPDLNVDAAALRRSIDSMQDGQGALAVTIVAFGSDQEGEYNVLPAHPAELEQLAGDLDAAFIPFFATDGDAETELEREIEERFADVLSRSSHYQLRFRADNAPAGTQTMLVRIGDLEADSDVNIGDIPPRIAVVTSSTQFQDRVSLTTTIDYQQSPVTEVQYLLNNLPLASSTEGPDFAVEIPVYTESFQQRFSPGNYQLIAAAKDERGLESRSDAVTIRVFAPPSAENPFAGWMPSFDLSILGILLLVVVVGVAIGVFLYQKFKGVQNGGGGSGSSQAPGSKGGLLHDDTARLDEQKTERFGNDKTERYNSSGEPSAHHRAFRIIVERGAPVQRFILNSNQRHLDIGRNNNNQIVLTNRWVTGNHARLALVATGVELSDNDSTNGTFIGPNKKKLANRDSAVLKSGDEFWCGPEVKLRIEEE